MYRPINVIGFVINIWVNWSFVVQRWLFCYLGGVHLYGKRYYLFIKEEQLLEFFFLIIWYKMLCVYIYNSIYLPPISGRQANRLSDLLMLYIKGSGIRLVKRRQFYYLCCYCYLLPRRANHAGLRSAVIININISSRYY